MARSTRPKLELHPDGRWIPATPGFWRYVSESAWAGLLGGRISVITWHYVEVVRFKGGLNVVEDGAEASANEIKQSRHWEWMGHTQEDAVEWLKREQRRAQGR